MLKGKYCKAFMMDGAGAVTPLGSGSEKLCGSATLHITMAKYNHVVMVNEYVYSILIIIL
jgi:hypothetical protein